MDHPHSIQDHISFLDDLLDWLIASSQVSAAPARLIVPSSEQKAKKHTSSSNARLGYCQHPKHQIYRLDASMTGGQLGVTPRRGRPPKGTKASDMLVVPPLTIRPLPKRLEKVVGFKAIRVCLTCLKRTDLDLEYLSDPGYVAPQYKKTTTT